MPKPETELEIKPDNTPETPANGVIGTDRTRVRLIGLGAALLIVGLVMLVLAALPALVLEIRLPLSIAGAIVGWSAIEAMARGKASMLGAASGAIAGLVAVTPAAGFVGPIGAIVLGLIASAFCYFFVQVVKEKFHYDGRTVQVPLPAR